MRRVGPPSPEVHCLRPSWFGLREQDHHRARLGAVGLAEASRVMARLVSAAVQGRGALGQRVATRVGRLGGKPDASALLAPRTSAGPR